MGYMIQEPNILARGNVECMRARIFYTDDGTAVDLAPPLPVGTQIIGMSVKVTELFDDTGTDLLEVGWAADPNALAKTADVDMTTTGTYSAFTGDNAAPFQIASARTIQALYNGSNSDATTGIADVTIWFAPMSV